MEQATQEGRGVSVSGDIPDDPALALGLGGMILDVPSSHNSPVILKLPQIGGVWNPAQNTPWNSVQDAWK